MRIRKTALISLLIIFSTLIPSSTADQSGTAWSEDSRAYSEGWPWPPLPNWWNRSEAAYKSQSFTDVRLGQWLPCKPEWSMNDCIQGINVYDETNKLIGPLTFVPNPSFDPFNYKQVWDQANAGSLKVDNYPHFRNPTNNNYSNQGVWTLPGQLTLASGKNELSVSVARMLTSLQVNVSGADGSSLPLGYYFETTLKSRNMLKHATWIDSNGKDPSVVFNSDGTVVFKGVTTKTPVPANGCEDIFGGNSQTARSSNAFIAINVNVAKYYENPNYQTIPGEIVTGTNGWWCQGGIYWDQQNRQIVVNVATTHYYEDGKTVVDGWFEVKIRGQLVRQLWGVTPQEASGYARVEVAYQDGTTKTATVSARYVPDKDWIDLRAYGFTYSNPGIKISLGKSATPSIAKPTPSALPKSTVAPKPVIKKITCVKGKIVKKVTTPTCPSGYKKI